MKRVILVLPILLCCLIYGQDKEEKKGLKLNKPSINIKKPNLDLRLGERIGSMAGNMLTSKTADLGTAAPTASLIAGFYDRRTKTSEVNLLPNGVKEGDHIAAITFFKQEGGGLLQLQGEVTCDGEPMEYMGMGTYIYVFDEPIAEPRVIHIKTETQDAEFVIHPIPEVEILSVNGDPTLPIIDLNEDMTIEFAAEPSNEKHNIKVGMLSDVMGTRVFNYFADFDLTEKREIHIPKEAFSNTEVNGQMNIGQFNKGENFIVLERKLRIDKGGMDQSQKVEIFPTAVMQSIAYDTRPVIVKGKQDEGIIANLSFGGGYNPFLGRNRPLGYEVHKPNARSGIPFSRGSKFGLASLTISGQTLKKETESGSSSYTLGDTRYTTTWTRTTTYQFPQLPDEYWETMMGDFYGKMTSFFKDSMNIDFVPVEAVTSTAAYNTLFSVNEVNTEKKISKTYKNTLSTSPQRLSEIFDISSSQSNENPKTSMMTEAGIDGLVSVEITFGIGANKNDNVILIPSVRFTITGMDETKDNRQGTYATGHITYRTGIPFNGDLAQSDPNYLAEILNVDNLIACMSYMLTNLQAKEVAMGYDKIWTIGE